MIVVHRASTIDLSFLVSFVACFVPFISHTFSSFFALSNKLNFSSCCFRELFNEFVWIFSFMCACIFVYHSWPDNEMDEKKGSTKQTKGKESKQKISKRVHSFSFNVMAMMAREKIKEKKYLSFMWVHWETLDEYTDWIIEQREWEKDDWGVNGWIEQVGVAALAMCLNAERMHEACAHVCLLHFKHLFFGTLNRSTSLPLALSLALSFVLFL